MNNEEIQRILQQYKDKKARDREYYHNHIKNDKDKIERRRIASRKYVESNPMKQIEYRQKNRERINLRNLVNYYKRNDRLDVFQVNKPDKYKRAIELNIIVQES
mgnify:CR=1 FL=1